MNDRLNGDGLIQSDRYEESMKDVVMPYLKERETVRTVQGDQSRPIYCVSYQAQEPRGTVVIVHGFTENAFKFSEVIFSLLQNGFCVVAYDQRGHGRSWRDESLKDDLSLTHVSDFGEYVRDLEAICKTVLTACPKPWMVFSHSMGGAVTGLFLSKHPEWFSKAVLCAPMIAPNIGQLSRGAASLLCGAFRLLSQGKKRIFASKPYAGPEDFATSCATGKERFDWYDAIKQQNPEFSNNGPTYGWTLEAVNVTKKLLAPGVPEAIACPVRMYAAERDFSVMPEEQKQFIVRVKHGERIPVPGSRHEIYRSNDEVLFPWWHEVLAFLSEK